jgi:phosphatidylserine/phosphatidylglycerophosphate/cardiolipin synthase-like enzyme
MALADLEAKYLDVTAQGPPISRGTTDVSAYVDGVAYFNAIHAAINGTAGANDAIYLVGWQLDIDWDLSGATPPTKIGVTLAEKASQGVDVRIVLNGTLIVWWLSFVPFGRNLTTAERLRSLTKAGLSTPPLANRVLFDWSGANWTGSHHQKATVVLSGGELHAFVGGLDYMPSFRDQAPHNTQRWPDNTPWGWHDIGVSLRGEAAEEVWENFRNRWEEARTLPTKFWKKSPGDLTESPKPFNPQPIPAKPTAAPTSTPAITGQQQSVQILRSRYLYKIPTRILPGGVPWTETPTGGLYEVWNVLRKAIAAAQTYIYVEDQFLEDSLHLEFIFSPGYSLYREIKNALDAKPNLRAIFVGSGKSDPGDPVMQLKNRKLTGSIEDDIVDELPAAERDHVAVWRVEDVTVHAKLMLIDDEFASIGSANFQSRSLYGIDSELQAAIVAEDDWVKNLRMDLWGEHWRLNRQLASVEQALEDLTRALGLWRRTWTNDPNIWRTAGNPPGFQPSGPAGHGALAPVGPTPLP